MGTRTKSSDSEISYKKSHKHKKKMRRKQKKDFKKLSESTKRVKHHSQSSLDSYEIKKKRQKRSRSWSSVSSSSFSKDLDHRSHSPRIYEKKNGTSHNNGLGGRAFRNQKSRNGRNFTSSNNMFYQKFQENYRRQIAGEKTNQLYQSAFPIKHIPEKLNFSYRLLGRNIFNKSSYSGNVSDGSMNGSSNGPMKRRRKIEKRFKNYMRFQAQQGNLRDPVILNCDKARDSLVRRLQIKSVSLKDDYESEDRRKSSSRSSSKSSSSSKLNSSSEDSSSRQSSDRSSRKKKTKRRKRNRQNSTSAESDSDSEFEVAEKSSETKNGIRKSKHKRKQDTTKSDSEASLLDLRDKLQPIGAYIKDRETMLEEMFRCIKGEKLQAMLPDILKTRSFEEIKARCLDQLECMSKKRILCILDGKEMTSSSGTEDSSAEDASAVEKFSTPACEEQSLVADAAQMKKEISPVDCKRQKSAKSVETTDDKELNEPQKMNIAHSNNNVISAQCVHADEDFDDYYEGFKAVSKRFGNVRSQYENNSASDAVFDVPKSIPSLRPKMDIRPIMSFTQFHRLNKSEIIDVDDDESNEDVLEVENTDNDQNAFINFNSIPQSTMRIDKSVDASIIVNEPNSCNLQLSNIKSTYNIENNTVSLPFEKSGKRHCSICSESYSDCSSCASYNSFCSLCTGRRLSSSYSMHFSSDSNESNESDDLNEVLFLDDDEELLLIEAEMETFSNLKSRLYRKERLEKLETRSVDSDMMTGTQNGELILSNDDQWLSNFIDDSCCQCCIQAKENEGKFLETNADFFMQDFYDEFLTIHTPSSSLQVCTFAVPKESL